ncbi:MAG TPA: Rieske (2Fe-2S) protein [Minicystis sp.]|nr:Rieske (2Fe-2S) protein [Minicystis sp.]
MSDGASGGSTSRRHFLTVLATGGAALGAVCLGAGGCLAGGPSGKIPAGNVKDLAVPSLQAVQGESVAIGRDEGGVYAMTLICTHASCDMATQGEVTAHGVLCSCHGSEFSPNGAVVVGPANAPLEHFLVTVDAGGNITIDADQGVSADQRAKV